LFQATSWRTIALLCLLLLGSVIPLIVCVVVVAESRAITLSLLLAPAGALLRYWLARTINTRTVRFPLGTFIANISGTIFYTLLAISMGLTIASPSSSVLPHNTALLSNPGWLFLVALQAGFCSSLTTMSTFVLELDALALFFSYVYLFTSIVVAYLLLLLMNGLFFWMADGTSIIPL
jgi:fluoride ion exporter CrcB/FEX